jgi:hypothetical protein
MKQLALEFIATLRYTYLHTYVCMYVYSDLWKIPEKHF